MLTLSFDKLATRTSRLPETFYRMQSVTGRLPFIESWFSQQVDAWRKNSTINQFYSKFKQMI